MKRFPMVLELMALLVILACGSSGVSGGTPAPDDDMITETESANTDSPVDTSSDNPAPAGTVITVTDVSLSIDKVDRPADTVVIEGNEFNPTPGPSEEYMILHATLTCNKAKSEKCSLFPTIEVKVVGSDGIVRDTAYAIAGVPSLLEPSEELAGGESISGGIVFLVPRDDTYVAILRPVSGLGEEGFLTLP